MGSSEVNIGFNENAKVSSRVLKPPGGGGGLSNIFSETESKSNPPRPKYNQQNSSNMNAVMGTVDPNKKGNGGGNSEQAFSSNSGSNNSSSDSRNAPSDEQSGRVRVPPGGFSSGLW